MPSSTNIDTGNAQILSGYSASALNADLIPSTYVWQYKWIGFYIGPDVYTGVLKPWVSFNGSDWKQITMYPMLSFDAGDVSGGGFANVTNGIYGVPVIAPYFKVTMTSYSSGTATGMLQLYVDGLPGFQMLDTYVRILRAANQIGYVTNDGNQMFSIAASKSSDTAVSIVNGMLARVLVTTAGSHQMTFYDSNSGASGDIIGVIPATATVTGIPFEFHAPVQYGIYLAGNASNHGVTVFYA